MCLDFTDLDVPPSSSIPPATRSTPCESAFPHLVKVDARTESVSQNLPAAQLVGQPFQGGTMSNASPGRPVQTAVDQSPHLPSHSHRYSQEDGTPPTTSASPPTTPQGRQQAPSPYRTPTAHPYNSPLHSRNAQNFTPTRPSPLSQIFFPPTDPDFDLTPNTNTNISPGMRIDPTLLNWPADNLDWPVSEELDDMFGPISPSPTKSRFRSGFDITGGRPLTERDFTLIPPPLSLTPAQHVNAPMMFGDLVPAPLSPIHRTPPSMSPDPVELNATRPLPVPSPFQLDHQHHVMGGHNRSPSTQLGSPSPSPLFWNDGQDQQITQRTYADELIDAANDFLGQPLQSLRLTSLSSTPESSLSAPTRSQPSNSTDQGGIMINNPISIQSNCNLCQRSFYPVYTSHPNDAGRAYCIDCIKATGERIVNEQKIKLGIGRSGRQAVTREETRIGDTILNEDSDPSQEGPIGEGLPNWRDGAGDDRDVFDVTGDDEMWAEWWNANGATTSTVVGGEMEPFDDNPGGAAAALSDGFSTSGPSDNGSYLVQVEDAAQEAAGDRQDSAQILSSPSLPDTAGGEASRAHQMESNELSDQWTQINAQEIRDARHQMGLMGSPRRQ